ncbi:MAG: TatD family hydrolase [Candidatus Aenigmatarchaeota archaeon]
MIDVHCHLEQPDYDQDREEVIEKCRKEMKAVITSCVHPADFELTMRLVEKYKNFLFTTVGIHPEYVKEIGEAERMEFLDIVRKNREKIVGIGEVGLDFLVEEEWRGKQKEMFKDFIHIAEELDKPLVVHARKAFAEAIQILEEEKVRKVLMHFFTANDLVKKVKENGWYVSVNTTLLTSKKVKKVVRDMPLEQILTETDAPWLGPGGKRNDPNSVKFVIEKISEIKKMSFEEVDEITTNNAIEFFNLKFD